MSIKAFDFMGWRLLAVAIGLVAVTVAWGQVPASPNGELTIESVQESSRKAGERTDIDEPTKAKILTAYQDAIGSLTAANEWSRTASEFEKAKIDAPANLDRVRTELSKPQPEKPQVDLPSDASLDQKEQKLAQLTTELKQARDLATSLDEERKRRADRRASLPAAIVEAKKRLEQVSTELVATSPAGENSDLTRAKQAALSARKKSIEAEIASYEQETLSYDARGDLLTAKRDLAAREVTRLDGLVRALQDIVNDRRRRDAQAAADAAKQARREAAKSYPAVAELAGENEEWAKRRTRDKVPDRIEKVTQHHELVTKLLNEVTSNFSTVRSKLNAAGLTHAMGLLLRRQRATLPNVDEHIRAIERRKDKISDAQLELIELEEVRANLITQSETIVQKALGRLGSAITEEERQEAANIARELLTARRANIDALISEYNVLFVKLVDVDGEERRLVTELELFREYVDERILWVRSTSLPNAKTIKDGWDALGWLLDGSSWRTVMDAVWKTVRGNPVVGGLVALIGLVLLAGQRNFRRRLPALADEVSRPVCTSIVPTLEALLLTVFIALLWPYVLGTVGLMLMRSTDASVFPKAVGEALLAVAAILFTIKGARQVCRRNGLGEAHFGWPARGLNVIRREFLWFVPLFTIVVFVVALLDRGGDDDAQNSLGRLAFVLAHVLFAALAIRLIKRGSKIINEMATKNPDSWARRARLLGYITLVIIPLFLAVLAIMGYYYTSLRITEGFHQSLAVAIFAVIASAVALRWVLLSRRQLGIEQSRRRREAARAEGKDDSAVEDDTFVNLTNISAQSRALIRTTVLVGFFIGLWFIWADTLPALGILDSVELWQVTKTESEVTTGADDVVTSRMVEKPVSITLANLGASLLILAITFISGRNVPGLLEMLIFQRLPLKPGVRYAISAVSSYAIWVVGFVLAFGAIGIGWAKVQWLVAAMTVGLGFGLQEIFANFVSGLIILFERPVRVGDTVTVGSISGTVTRIRIRATTITDWNRKELIIPNKEFVTGQVVNWTLSDSTLRVVVPVGIAYGSNVELAEKTLLEVATAHPLVLHDPKPDALFLGFADSSLAFELRVFIATIDDFMKVRHGIHKAIDAAFREKKIEISFPQRDIHVRSVNATFPVVNPLPKPEQTQ